MGLNFFLFSIDKTQKIKHVRLNLSSIGHLQNFNAKTDIFYCNQFIEFEYKYTAFGNLIDYIHLYRKQ